MPIIIEVQRVKNRMFPVKKDVSYILNTHLYYTGGFTYKFSAGVLFLVFEKRAVLETFYLTMRSYTEILFPVDGVITH